MKTPYTITEERDAGGGAKEFLLEVSPDALSAAEEELVVRLAQHAERPGFRKGRVPLSLIRRETGEQKLLGEAAEQIVNDSIRALLIERSLRFIGSPSVSITMLARGNPLKFTVRIVVPPAVTLPDYRAIAGEHNRILFPTPVVSEEEVKTATDHIAQMLGPKDAPPGAEARLNDEMVKKLGNFTSVAEFTERLKKDLLADKERQNQEKHLTDLLEKLSNTTKLVVPEELIDREVGNIEAEFESMVQRTGQTTEGYLSHTKKTLETMRSEWRPNAEKRARLELILPAIAKSEKLTVPPEEVEHETKHLLEHHKDANHDAAKQYVEHALLRKKVLQFLENCR